MTRPVVTLVLVAAAFACRNESGKSAPQSSRPAAPSYVDSALPRQELLRRFRADLPDAPTELTGGETSRAALVRRFTRALEQRDTAAIVRMAVNRAEFAYLVYESSPFSRPPYGLSPGLMWFQMQEQNRAGILRALARYGGRPVPVDSVECAESPEQQGENLIWTGCMVRGRASAPFRLFGPILERHGQFKFLTYANSL